MKTQIMGLFFHRLCSSWWIQKENSKTILVQFGCSVCPNEIRTNTRVNVTTGLDLKNLKVWFSTRLDWVEARIGVTIKRHILDVTFNDPFFLRNVWKIAFHFCRKQTVGHQELKHHCLVQYQAWSACWEEEAPFTASWRASQTRHSLWIHTSDDSGQEHATVIRLDVSRIAQQCNRGVQDVLW